MDMSELSDIEKLKADFLEEYRDAIDVLTIAQDLPPVRGLSLKVSMLCDSNHVHDKKTRRSITGLLCYVGSTPVFWSSKRQGAVASSTYASEFMALRQATEECISIRYCLCCLGIPVDEPCNPFGDNLNVIMNPSNPEADIKKKHVAISFHLVREAIAAGIIAPFWLKGENNLVDIMTKQINGPAFQDFCSLLY